MRVIAADCNRKRLSGVDRSAVFCAVQHLLIPAFPSLPHRFSTSCPQHSTPFPGPPPFASQRRNNRCAATLPQSPYLAFHSRCHAQTAHTPHQVSHTFSTYSYTHFHNPNLCLSTATGPPAANPAVHFWVILHILSQVLSGRFQQGRTGLITTCVMARVPARRTAHAKPFIAAFPITFIMHFTMLIVQNHIRQSARPAKLSPNPSIPLPASLLPPPFHRFSTIPPHGLSPPPSGSHKPSAALTNQRFHTQPPPNTARRFSPYTTSVCAHFPHVFHISSMPVHTPLRQHKTPPSQSGKRGNFHENVIRKRDGRSSAPSTKRNRQGRW